MKKKALSVRQELILLSLKKHGFLTRDQLGAIHKLGKIRNVNRILSDLSEYLQSFREGYDTVYYLNSNGKDYTQAKKAMRRTQYTYHTIMRNQFYIYAGQPKDWKVEIKLGDKKESKVCDAWFQMNGYYHILEVDNQQKMSENRNKLKAYSGMNERGAITKHFGYFPPIIWVTTTELRRKQLVKMCEEFGLSHQVLTIMDIK
ncbi:hypothetical protein [Bacillus phage DZ1]|uniref:Replication-relaxation n=1 Tax=Bacillus phage DZ1 TaxID=3075862 RepID=A0AA96EMY8_9CAUD|nr:hypothetical protein [Bacillus phage DZ1]